MIPGFVEELEIKNIKMIRNIAREVSWMKFKINTIPYILSLKKINGQFYPMKIFHDFVDEECEYCGVKGKWFLDCDELVLYIDEIFERLEKHPEIRLRLMF